MKKILFFLTALLCMITSCSEDEMPMTQSTGQTVEKFRSYFYNDDGSVRIHRLGTSSEGVQGTTWAAAVRTGVRPCEVFQDITGVAAPVQDEYSYSYVSPDGSCHISIKGTAEANEKAVYAVMRVSVPSCPEIEEIYITAEEFFKDENSESEGTFVPGVPVIL